MEETLELRDILEILKRRRRLIAGVFIAGMAAALLFLLLVTPRYTSEATLKFNPSRFEISAQKSNVGSELFDRLMAGEIAAVKSPAILMKVLKAEDLLNDPELNKTTMTEMVARGLNGLFGYAQADANHDAKILERFRKKLQVGNPDRTNLISISYTSWDAKKSALVTNAVANAYLAQHLDNRLASTPLAAKWLNERKVALRERWRRSEGAAEKFKAKNNLSYVSGEKLREQYIDRLNEQLVLAGTKTEAARARVEQVRQLLKSGNYQQLANMLQSDVLTQLRDRFAAASQREASLSISLLPGHPEVRKARAETASLRAQIENAGRRVLDNLEVRFRAAREREELIRGNFDKTISGIQDSSPDLVKLRELERMAASDRSIFEAFLNRTNETLEQSTGQFANYRLIQVAQAPTQPSFPSKFKVLVLAAIGSLAAGLGLSFILETLCNTFRTGAHVSDVLKLPVLATLPKLTRKELTGAELRRNPERVLAHHRNTPFAHGVAALNIGLRPAHGDAPARLLAVTSAQEREGKTMTAASLAQEAALSGCKVLLIDGNWKNPRLRAIFETHSRAVSVNGRRKNGQSEPLLLHDLSTGLDILPAMAGAGNSSRFGASEEFAALLSSARDTYDLIILDTGPVLSDSDSWGPISEADGTLFVIQWNQTRRDVVARALRTLETLDAKVIGVVLNGSDLQQMEQENQVVSTGFTRRAAPVVNGRHGIGDGAAKAQPRPGLHSF